MRKCDVVFGENYSYSLEDAYAKIFECVDENGILCIQDFPDDECEIEAASIQVNIWSRSDQQALVKRIKKLMKKNGFLFQEGNDQIETDTGIFINAMRFLILKEAEETEE